ncbi:hypothetical protein DH2020_001479 [Rehmannia glutinosa]|uniref:Ammonium transporter AmtB-like domain-containing protein n=1 Tax=Rehmannia glutinosa TaxID=99300 RepID=A0ABR0Y066_REHGL
MTDPKYAWLPSNLQPDEANPDWMNKGDNAWQLTAATMVGLQSIPGLVILYGSIVKKKWAVNSAFMALYAFAAVLICWVGWAYQMSFGDTFLPFLGKIDDALDQHVLLKQAFAYKFPNATMLYFQFVFAAITLILIAGALLGRMNFIAWMMFVPLWVTFSYTIGAFSIWCPNGWLAKMGLIDYSGGFVIHLSSGVAAISATFRIIIAGWAKDNEGSRKIPAEQYPTDACRSWAAMDVLNTHVCAATSLLTWLLLDILFFEKPSVIGVVQGWAAIIMGILSGSIPWFTMMVLHKKIWLLKQVDDTMAVFHTHAVAGTLGGLLTGFFANPKLSRLFYLVETWEHYIGLAYGIHEGRAGAGLKQMGIQILGVVFIVGLNVVVTSLICLLIRLVVPLRLSEEELSVGDDAVHGEEAYALWGDGEKFEKSVHNSVYGVEDLELQHKK